MAVTVQSGAEDRNLVKSIRWFDGMVLAGVGTVGLLYPSVGSSVVAMGGLGAALVWALSSLIGVLQAKIVSEVAAMFPEKSGGIGILASEGLKRYGSWIGALSGFAYWFGWSIVLSVNTELVGEYVKATVLPDIDPRIIGTLMLVVLYLLNVFGVRTGVWTGYFLAVLTIVPMILMILGGLTSGAFHWYNLMPFRLPGGVEWLSLQGLSLIATWMFIAGWSAYAMESAATLAPEYHDTVTETHRALRGAALVGLLFYVLMPVVSVGVLGVEKIQESPYTAFAPLLHQILGPTGGTVVLVTVIASLILTANLATIGGSRTLYQLSRDGLTLKMFGYLNKKHIPSVGMTFDILVNLAALWFLKNPLALVVASNVGYFVGWILMLLSFVMLRKNEPTMHRPIRLHRGWVGLGVLLLVLNIIFLLIGAPSYGWGPLGVGLGILVLSLVTWFYRVKIEEHRKYELRG